MLQLMWLVGILRACEKKAAPCPQKPMPACSLACYPNKMHILNGLLSPTGILRIAKKQPPKLGDYEKEWQGFIFTITFRKSLTESVNTQQPRACGSPSALDCRLLPWDGSPQLTKAPLSTSRKLVLKWYCFHTKRAVLTRKTLVIIKILPRLRIL